ncbi:pyridoxamine 5'-phosphate oxidase family protein [Lentzea pudingi]|uniref:pyridoxamine 5'-phosphate oxidase family protein n=1 Tax=Lentzea pudingi TaxID=1789439 RepID=UPI001663C541|nr:pyridoxamine 5'-phosphate oxidase family protein [Lentzea pudingi]
MDLSTAMCWEVMRSAFTGRLLYTVNALPSALPVRIAVHQESILFAIDSKTAFQVLPHGHNFCALHVDDVCPQKVVCRSVVVLGAADRLCGDDPVLLSAFGLTARPEDFVYARIEPTVINGVAVDLCD